MYEVADVFEMGKAQDVVKSEPKECPWIDENGQMFRAGIIDEDD